jgi:molybdopterin synthase catalytic subunit
VRIVLQDGPFNFGAEADRFAQRRAVSGAVVTFTGIVRDLGGELQAMEIEHYPGMTEAALTGIAAQAAKRWELEDTLIIHRHGRLLPGEMIMMVATAAPHRVAAFEAAEFLMDFLKSRAPFWKREVTKDGSVWVDVCDEDEAALTRW